MRKTVGLSGLVLFLSIEILDTRLHVGAIMNRIKTSNCWTKIALCCRSVKMLHKNCRLDIRNCNN